jgi:hypothetical protein
MIDSTERHRRLQAFSQGYWEIPEGIDHSNFDFEWRPYVLDRPYIHQFGTQHQKTGGPKFILPDNEGVKYRDEQKVLKLPNTRNYKIILEDVDIEFDYSWHHDESEPPFIYIWGNQWNDAVTEPTIQYTVPGATQIKYMYDKVAYIKPSTKFFKILIEGAKFDFSYRPSPKEPKYIYVWGNQWNDATTEPTIELHVTGAVDRKYMFDQVAYVPGSMNNWTNTINNKDFDYSWRPNPYSAPQIYQWENNGPIYTAPGASAVVLMSNDSLCKVLPKYHIKTTLEDLINEHVDEVFWALNHELNYDKFDFNWKPNQENFRHINVFGSESSKDLGTYYVNGPLYKLGYKDFNYVNDTVLDVDSNLSMIWIDTGSINGRIRYEQLKERFPDLQKTRFFNTWIETINRCVKKSQTKLMWVLSSDIDYTDFDFKFYPSSWHYSMLHVFGTQWGKWGNTYLVNTEQFTEQTKNLEKIEHLKTIVYQRSKKAVEVTCKYDILYIDYGNEQNTNLQYFNTLGVKVSTITYHESYLNTVKVWLEQNIELTRKANYYIWVTSSVCDYSSFNFSWYCDPFQYEQLHVFASQFNGTVQKFGDTFVINVKEFYQELTNLLYLENYSKKINYIGYVFASRLQHPIIEHQYDSQVDAIKNLSDFNFPYAELFTSEVTNAHKNCTPVNLWVESKSPVTVLSKGASNIIVPKLALKKIENEVYDYPYIIDDNKLGESRPLDIVFISNGEKIAEDNYDFLHEHCRKNNILSRLKRVKDVQGRVESQHQAAHISQTSWYFLINSKLRVDESFNWFWQPDRLQKSKHYIFNALNPVNKLRYGHQAIVANNKKLTLSTITNGLDFTLDSPHEVVNIDCGVAMYNTDPWTTWRTAFREAIKLKANTDYVSKWRLQKWTSQGEGDYEEISRQGALDGIDYFISVNGDLEKLKLSYDWAWINSYYLNKYGQAM